MKRLLLGGVIGAALVYFLDPQHGARRRQQAQDRLGSTQREVTKQAQDVAQQASGKKTGVVQTVAKAGRQGKQEYDDETLTEKVKTELFREPEVKGRVNVSVENGVVVLRGEVQTPDDITSIEKETKRVQGVKAVENLLHLPGTPAPQS
jgi:osmotically-inducible protein OsmY